MNHSSYMESMQGKAMQANAPSNPVTMSAELLWKEQLTDYRKLLQIAHEETDILSTNRLELLYHTQSKRERLSKRIMERDRVLQANEVSIDPALDSMLIEISSVIETVLRLDNDNVQRLKAELGNISASLVKLNAGKTALRQYKPVRQRRPQFLNRKV
jgi:hypothetical protein